jgi:hypothetical protein
MTDFVDQDVVSLDMSGCKVTQDIEDVPPVEIEKSVMMGFGGLVLYPRIGEESLLYIPQDMQNPPDYEQMLLRAHGGQPLTLDSDPELLLQRMTEYEAMLFVYVSHHKSMLRFLTGLASSCGRLTEEKRALEGQVAQLTKRLEHLDYSIGLLTNKGGD